MKFALALAAAFAAVPPPPMQTGGGVLLVSASKDTDYYRRGFVNPNVNNKMYWKDSINVLQDLDQFQSLHVQYEGCVWSKWGSRYSTYQGDEDQNDEESTEQGCGAGAGDGEEGEYYWYLGRTQCFRANAAFTLYGVLKGDDAPEPKNGESQYCRKATYINSFFTTFGVEAFSAPLGLDTSSANSFCSMVAPDDEAQAYYYDQNADDDGNEEHNYKNYAAYESYGTACQNSKYVINKYQGAYCDGADGYLDTTSYLETFNEAIESMGCVEIYNANSYNNNQNRQRERKLEDYDDDTYDVDFDEISPVNILQYSRACSIRQYPIQCPDPYKLLQKYDTALTRALSSSPTWKSSGEKTMNALSGIFLAAGAALLFFAWRIKRRVAQKPAMERNRNITGYPGPESELESESEYDAPAPASKLAPESSTVSARSAATAGSTTSVASSIKEAFEQVLFCQPKNEGEEQTQAGWEKQRVAVVELVDLDESVASSTKDAPSSTRSAQSMKSVGANEDAANPVLAWDGHTVDSPSRKLKLKHDFPQQSSATAEAETGTGTTGSVKSPKKSFIKRAFSPKSSSKVFSPKSSSK